ncbi:hypothetical protein IW148_000175 [Coemansia sp. RSA 1199]|nr:hypothetical protein IW148_000175 [Coemansia sp. RSA 1199]
MFYSNCATCYAASSDHKNVTQDCTSVLKLNSTDGEDLSEADALFNKALSFTALRENSQVIDSVEKVVAAVEKTDGSGVQRIADIYSLFGVLAVEEAVQEATASRART